MEGDVLRRHLSRTLVLLRTRTMLNVTSFLSVVYYYRCLCAVREFTLLVGDIKISNERLPNHEGYHAKNIFGIWSLLTSSVLKQSDNSNRHKEDQNVCGRDVDVEFW